MLPCNPAIEQGIQIYMKNLLQFNVMCFVLLLDALYFSDSVKRDP